MTLNTQNLRTSLNAILLLVIFISHFFNPVSAGALGNGETTLPDFREFVKTVKNNNTDVISGVYVPDVLALPIVQQPADKAGYVSFNDGEITQFGMPSRFGNVGLLAHNNLSGRFFTQLAVGQEVRLIYGNGKIEYFVISEILRYQALQPTSPYSSFRNLTGNETLIAEQMFKRAYTGDRHVTFQTCIEANGNFSWGRLFVIALPKSQYSGFNRLDLD